MRFVALLRGVNVGGKNLLPMARLKAALEAEGFREVTTYLASGNALFDASGEPAALAAACEKLIARRFRLDVRVLVLPGRALRAAVAKAPPWWGAAPGSKHNAIFVLPPATARGIVREVGEVKPEYEQVAVRGGVIFWSAPVATFGRTRWSRVVGTRAYQDLTIRNANTARALAGLAG